MSDNLTYRKTPSKTYAQQDVYDRLVSDVFVSNGTSQIFSRKKVSLRPYRTREPMAYGKKWRLPVPGSMRLARQVTAEQEERTRCLRGNL